MLRDSMIPPMGRLFAFEDVPSDYAAALDAVVPGVFDQASQPTAPDNAPPGANWVDRMTALLPAIAATWQQKQILSIQLERARQGLPPLAASDYGIGVSVGLSPETRRMLLWGGAALLVVLVLLSMRRR